jgi:hypothetical protein
MNVKLERRLVELEKRAPQPPTERVTVELCGINHARQIVARAVWDNRVNCFVPIDADIAA